MTVYRPPALDKSVPIVDPQSGRITPAFQRFWQNLAFTAADGANQASDISSLTGRVTTLEGEVASLSTSVGTKVAKGSFAAYVLPTGTLDRSTFATYTAPTISAIPTQAEVQALANHMQLISQHVAALITDLKT